MTGEQQARLSGQREVAAAARALLGGAAVPYYAHLRLRTEAGERDMVLGIHTRTGPRVSVLDWQRAPLASVFFEHGEGEDYELEVEGRILSGTVLHKHLVRFEQGELVELITPDARLVRGAQGRWSAGQRDEVRLTPLAGRHARSPVDVELDPAQRRIVELPAHQSALILGEAGCGKTTVGLHRVAALHRQAKVPPRTAVIVPTEALARLTAVLLERLHLRDVEVWRYDDWAARQARRAFTGLPRKESQNATGGVVHLKRHPALRPALVEYARRTPGRAKKKLWARREDLLALFGDRALMEQVVRDARGTLSTPAIQETIEHAKIQFSEKSEVQYAHVEAERLQAVDGRSIDEATPMEDAQTIDSEDYAVLFELDRLRAEAQGERPTSPRRYDLIMVDEAQELAPLELSLIGRSLSPKGTLIVAGDAEQRLDPGSGFTGWETTMADLGAAEFERHVLQVSYRCPPRVTALAKRVREAQPVEEGVWRASGELGRSSFDNECHLAAWGVEAIRELLVREPGAHVAFIARSAEAAKRLAHVLSRGIDVQLALQGNFNFGVGVHVTSVEEVKGLEFDHVVVPDANAQSYANQPGPRRALYVAITRASHQLVLGAVGRWTELLDGSGEPR